jgi:hypothetical protein
VTFTHWKKLENPDYIGSYAFQPGEEKIVTIQRVQREMVNGPDGKREECTVLHFREAEKPMILNATNGKMVAKMAGTPYIEQWVGVRIAIGVEKVRAFGDYVDAVRVKNKKLPQIKTAAEPEILCEDCGQPIKAAGKMAPAQVAALGKEKFGAAVCATCGAKRKAAAEVKPDEAGSDAAE